MHGHPASLVLEVPHTAVRHSLSALTPVSSFYCLNANRALITALHCVQLGSAIFQTTSQSLFTTTTTLLSLIAVSSFPMIALIIQLYYGTLNTCFASHRGFEFPHFYQRFYYLHLVTFQLYWCARRDATGPLGRGDLSPASTSLFPTRA